MNGCECVYTCMQMSVNLCVCVCVCVVCVWTCKCKYVDAFNTLKICIKNAKTVALSLKHTSDLSEESPENTSGESSVSLL